MDVNLLPNPSCVVIDLASYRKWRASQSLGLRLRPRCAHGVDLCFDCALESGGDK